MRLNRLSVTVPGYKEGSMIRVVRRFIAKPGKERELIDVLKEIKAYSATQGITGRIFTEPWGLGGAVHIHNDFEDAARAQSWWQTLSTNSRAEEPLRRIQLLIEGHRVTSFLVKTT